MCVCVQAKKRLSGTEPEAKGQKERRQVRRERAQASLSGALLISPSTAVVHETGRCLFVTPALVIRPSWILPERRDDARACRGLYCV